MGRVFAVRPKRIKRTNGQVLTPEMEIKVNQKVEEMIHGTENKEENKDTKETENKTD